MSGINDEYYSALDRGYSPLGDIYGPSAGKSGGSHQGGDIVSDNFKGLSLKEIGISAPPMKDQLESLKSRIFQGATKIELGFWGKGKGSMGQGSTTPGMYDKEMRQAIKELATLNEMRLSTHVSPTIGNWSGLGQNKFSDQERASNIREAKRSIDFAADVTQGGAVVIHTGEFPRPIYQKYGDEGFEMYPEEKKDAVHYLVDSKTGDIISGVKENEQIWEPVEQTDENGDIIYLKDEQGNFVLDDFGNKMSLYVLDDNKNPVVEKKTFHEFAEEMQEKGITDRGKIAKEFFRKQQMTQIDHATGQAKYFGDGYHRGVKQMKDITEEVEFLKKIEKHMSPEKFKDYTKEYAQKRGHKIKPGEDIYEMFDEMRDQIKRGFEYGRETLSSGMKQKHEMLDKIDRAVTIEEYGMDKTSDSIARLGMYAWEKTQAKRQQDSDFKDLFVSPENIFPEQYGAHPKELKNIVLKSRARMAEYLHKRGMSEGEAKRIAERHLKATFDVGHAYTWRKYFNGNDQDFNKWLMDQVDDLNKHKIIGHIHISDNFGYEDEHVTPGLGKVPIKEFVEKMRKAGVRDLVVEPAHQDYKAILGGWREFGSSIYSVSKPGISRDRWTDIEGSYFGAIRSPTYVVGEYSPSQDFRGAPFYTGLGFE